MTNKSSREDYPDSDRSSIKSKIDLREMDKVLFQIQSTYNTNLQAQELYIDIIKKKKKSINSKFIKEIYAMFTENKANQICFEKELQNMSNEFDERLLQRYYARVIELGIKKISYFWINEKRLSFLSPAMVSFVKEIYTCYNEIHKLKSLDTHLLILKLLFQENCKIEQMIYETLIDDGYLMSMDEFYRINGVGLVGDVLFQRKSSFAAEETQIEQEQNQSFAEESSRSPLRSVKLNKKRNRKHWLNNSQKPAPTPKQSENDKIKIKKMVESMLSSIKSGLQQEGPKPSVLQVIKQQIGQDIISGRSQLNSAREMHKKKNSFMVEKKIERRVSKVETSKSMKRSSHKRVSIELMSYFSSEFKSALSDLNDVDINCLSELLVVSEPKRSNGKIMPFFLGKNSNEINIHSSQSLNKLRDQRKRGKLIDLVMKQKISQNFEGFEDEINEAIANKNCLSRSRTAKLSFKSAPGVFITFSKKSSSNFKDEKSKAKAKVTLKKFTVHAHIKNQNLFENELIFNQLSTHQPTVASKNGKQHFNSTFNHFLFGIGVGDEQPMQNFLRKKLLAYPQAAKASTVSTFETKQLYTQQQSSSKKFRYTNSSPPEMKKSENIRSLTQQNRPNIRIRRNETKNTEHMGNEQEAHKMQQLKNGPFYTVFDRHRRKIIDVR